MNITKETKKTTSRRKLSQPDKNPQPTSAVR